MMEEVLSPKRQALIAINAARKVVFAAGLALVVLGLAGAVGACTWLFVTQEWFGVLYMDELPGLDATGWGCVVAASAAALVLITFLLPNYRCRGGSRDQITWYFVGVLVNVAYWCAWPAFHVVKERYFEGPLDPTISTLLSRLFAPVDPMLHIAKIIAPERFGLYVYHYVVYVFVAIAFGTACWSVCVLTVQGLAERRRRTALRPNSR